MVFSIKPDINGSFINARIRVNITEAAVFKNAERFLIDKSLEICFASAGDENSSFGTKSSKLVCSSCTSSDICSSSSSGSLASSPVKSIGLVAELMLICAVLSESDTGVNFIVAVEEISFSFFGLKLSFSPSISDIICETLV